MIENIEGLLDNVTKNKLSTVSSLCRGDVAEIWDVVCSFIEKQMFLEKGTCIKGLGTFTFIQYKLDIGNNKSPQIQRPVFLFSEKLAQTLDLSHTKYFVPGHIPVQDLNYNALSHESKFNRDIIERCVKELISALTKAVQARKNVDLVFKGIGRLTIRDSRVKMKFSRYFLNQMESSETLVSALQNRPHTADSVMSDRPCFQVQSRCVILPKQINSDGSLPTVDECNGLGYHPDSQKVKESLTEGQVELPVGNVTTNMAVNNIMNTNNSFSDTLVSDADSSRTEGQKSSGLKGLALAKSTVLSLDDDTVMDSYADKNKNNINLVKPSSAPVSERQTEALGKNKTESCLPSECIHTNREQEVCYLCHQRYMRNVLAPFHEEKRKKIEEEERLISQFKAMKDTEEMIKEQNKRKNLKDDLYKIQAFNYGTGNEKYEKSKHRNTDFHRSFLIMNRPFTPPRFLKQKEYEKDLGKQVEQIMKTRKKQKEEEDFLGRLEQVQIAEELASQEESYWKKKAEKRDKYKKALDAQIQNRAFPVSKYEPDEVYFGKNDSTVSDLAKKRRKAHEMLLEQQEILAEKKRATILKQLSEKKKEDEILARSRKELIKDNAAHYKIQRDIRKHLEDDWNNSVGLKNCRECEAKNWLKDPGIPLLEQCDKYHRCKQCQRRLDNFGKTNFYCDTYYIPGCEQLK